MSIINSVVMGAARKKVGEVTTAIVHGRTIAKKYQPKVANPRTMLQVNQRTRIFNIVTLFRILIAAVMFSYPRKKTYQSAFNAFTKSNVASMPSDVQYTSISLLINALVGTSSPLVFSRGTLLVGNFTYTSTSGLFSLAAYVGENRIVAGDNIVGWGITTAGVCLTFSAPITAAMINTGTYTVTGTAAQTYACFGAYVQKSNKRDVSTSIGTWA